jgi:hypothetical protein
MAHSKQEEKLTQRRKERQAQKISELGVLCVFA